MNFKNRLLGSCCLILLFALPAAAQAQDQPKHLTEALKFLKDLAPQNTAYQHKDTSVRWKGVNGATANESFTDCSGFLDSLFRHCYGLDKAYFEKWFGTKRPLARHYHDAIVAQNKFKKIERIQHVHPGDLIAVKYEPGAMDTGHVMLVTKLPQPLNASKPLVPGTQQWEVAVLDQSRSGHGITDTRHQPDGSFRSGLGTGNLRLYVDEAGKFMGYSWSTSTKSTFNDQKTRNLVVGRLMLEN